jgi:hypothetical protein
MTSQLHHGAGWHCIIRLQRQLYLIARTTDETFCLAAKTLQNLQILSSLSPSLYRSVSSIAKKLPAIAILAKLLCMLTQLSKWRSHADNLPCSMEVISWDLPEGFCSLIKMFHEVFMENSQEGCLQGGVLVSVCQHQSQV